MRRSAFWWGALVGATASAACSGTGSAPTTLATPAPIRQTVTFAPGTTQYRVASHIRVEQQLGDQVQVSESILIYFLTARLETAGDHWRVTFLVDSVPRYQGSGPQGDANRARGARFAGTLTPNGEIGNLGGGDSTVQLLRELAEELPHFFPTLPPAGVEAGAHWSDSLVTNSTASGVPLTTSAVSEHDVAVPSDSGPDPAFPVRTSTTYTFSGSGSQGGESFTVQGEGRRIARELFTMQGRYVGKTVADSSTFTISMRGGEFTIPGRQARADTLSVIR